MQDEFGQSVKKSALTFGIVTLIMGLPTVIFFQQGVFDQYDYWAGTVVLVVFALAETILFAWVFGIDKGWKEITDGADIRLPKIYKPILKYVTPVLLLVIFVGSLIQPKTQPKGSEWEGREWEKAFTEGWDFDNGSIIGQITDNDIEYNRTPFSSVYEADNSATILSVDIGHQSDQMASLQMLTAEGDTLNKEFNPGDKILVKTGDVIEAGFPIAEGWHLNPIFYRYFAKFMLLGLFIYLSILVRMANNKRKLKNS